MAKRFSAEFKKQAVEKALSRQKNVAICDVAKDLGVGYSTLTKWISKAELQVSSQEAQSDERPSEWSAKQRLEAIRATYNLSENDLGAYCRQNGIYPHHISEWQKEFENMVSPQEQLKVSREEKRQLKAENKALQKELRRKEKALAEASALLILQKKAQAIWGNPEER